MGTVCMMMDKKENPSLNNHLMKDRDKDKIMDFTKDMEKESDLIGKTDKDEDKGLDMQIETYLHKDSPKDWVRDKDIRLCHPPFSIV